MDINATIIGQTIAMIVFVWFCMKFVWPLIIEMIEERQTKIADGLAAADKGSNALEEAEKSKRQTFWMKHVVRLARSLIRQTPVRTGIVDEGTYRGRFAEKERILEAAPGRS